MLGSGSEPELPAGHTVTRVDHQGLSPQSTTDMHTTIPYLFCFTFRPVFNKLHEVFKLYYKVDFVFDGFAQLYTDENILNLRLS